MNEPPRVYLDANVFVAAMETRGAHSDHAWWVIQAIEDGDLVAVTSELTLAEVLVRPIELGAAELAAAYEAMIMSAERFHVIPVRRDILHMAAQLRARRKSIRLPDAIHIGTALNSACGYLVSDDLRLPTIDGLKVLGITPFTVDDLLAERS